MIVYIYIYIFIVNDMLFFGMDLNESRIYIPVCVNDINYIYFDMIN